MNFMEFFRRESENSAKLAKDRLRMLIVHETVRDSLKPSFPPAMEREIQEELQRIIKKYVDVTIEIDQIATNISREDGKDVIAVDINIPKA